MLEPRPEIFLALSLAALTVSAVGMCFVRRNESKAGPRPAPWSDQPSPGPRSTSPGSGNGRVPVTAKDSRPDYRIQMNGHAHAVEFVRWMRDHGFVGRYAAAEILDYYAWFAIDFRAFPLPQSLLLAALNGHGGVRKKRDRIKDPKTGRVLKLASGSPERTTYYTIGEAPAEHLPAGVAATPPGRRVPSKAKPAGGDDLFVGEEFTTRKKAA